jgi:hypothetical protein
MYLTAVRQNAGIALNNQGLGQRDRDFFSLTSVKAAAR